MVDPRLVLTLTLVAAWSTAHGSALTFGNLIGGGTASTIHEFTTAGELVQKLFVPGHAGATITALASEPSGFILTGGNAGQVLRLSLSGTVLDEFSIPIAGGTVQSLAVEKGGTWLAGGTAGQVLRLSSLGVALEALSVPVPGQTVFSLAVEPTGNILAGGTASGVVRFTPEGDVLEALTLNVPGATVLSLAVGPDGTIYAGGTGSTVSIFTSSGTSLGSFAVSGYEGGSVQSLALVPVPLPGGAWLLLGALGGLFTVRRP